MGIERVREYGRVSTIGTSAVSKGSYENPSNSFQNQMGNQLKEHYRKQVTALFDEIALQSCDIFDNINLVKFITYRGLISELLTEIVKNAYYRSSECVIDSHGKRKIYTTVNIIDEKLDSLASDLLLRDERCFDYLSRMDEILGLIMDLLL